MSAFFDLTSLRGKITSAYIALAVGTMTFGVIAFLDLLFLQRQVAEGEVISALKDAVSGMRREEKNLFFYADTGASIRADAYAASSLDILRGYQASRGSDAIRPDPSHTLENLQRYRLRLESWNDASTDGRPRLEGEISDLGDRIYLSADALSKQERSMLETAVQESQWFLLASLLVIVLAIYLLGRRLERAVLAPLKQLESRLMPIAAGRFKQLQPPSTDREFITFTSAFNRMLKELEIHQRRMLQSEKLASLGILAAGVAHELNNPLSNISSSCQLLIEELTEAEPGQLNTWLQQIDSETVRGRNIVRTLLDFGSQRTFHKERIRLLDVVDDTRTIIGKTLREYSATLTVNIPAGLTLEIDKQRIQQLFINLIQNALHAAGPGVQVRISAMLCESGVSMIPDGAQVAGDLKCISDYAGRFVEILVSDDGPGIPAERLSRVFDPFFTSSEPGQGAGLGLFIVQEIVSEHDGCVAIVSRPGTGTQIIALLPGGDADHD